MSIELQADYANDDSAADTPAPFQYQALSSAAVSALATSVLSCLALLDWWLGLIPVVSITLAIYALRLIRARSGELTGGGLAKVAIMLSIFFLAVGWSRLGYIYATEVPDGYRRIGYAVLQPQVEVSGQTIPPAALALDGQKVFIKGYVYPGAQTKAIRRFLLVRDQGSCCFGGNPKLTERIQVSLSDPRGMAYTAGICKVAGLFRVEVNPSAVDGPGGIIYHLDEAMLR